MGPEDNEKKTRPYIPQNRSMERSALRPDNTFQSPIHRSGEVFVLCTKDDEFSPQDLYFLGKD